PAAVDLRRPRLRPAAQANRQAGDRLEDAVDLLDLLDDDRAYAGDVGSLHRGDDVVFPGDGVRQFDALDPLTRPGNLDRFTRRRIDKDIRSHCTLLDEFRSSEYGFGRR